jgi:hypothetical protein
MRQRPAEQQTQMAVAGCHHDPYRCCESVFVGHDSSVQPGIVVGTVPTVTGPKDECH